MLPRLPDDIRNTIFEKAATDHFGDFCAQRLVIEREQAAYLELQSLRSRRQEDADIERALAAACKDWPGNYQMQLHVCRRQLEHWELLVQHRDDRLPGSIVKAIKDKAAQDWPHDFVLRYLSINRQCEAWLAIEEMRISA